MLLESVGSTVSANMVQRMSENLATGSIVLADHHPTGISTGVFAELRNEWPDLVAQAEGVSSFAVELSALAEPELEGLIEFLESRPPLPFRYVAVHAPTKNRQIPEAKLVRRLARMPLPVRSLVVHPDTISDVRVYRELRWRLCVENMDSRKGFGTTADELADLFADLPEAGFVFDIAHAHEVDPSMELAEELLDRLGGRLRHVHLSSIRDGRHVPLTEDDERLFRPLLARCSDVPWILEALVPERWQKSRHLTKSSELAIS